MCKIVNALTIAIFTVIASACAIEAEENAEDQPQGDDADALGTVEQASTYAGCPDGYVCIYPQDAGWNNGVPASYYYYYGTYNLSNQFGYHYVYNHQTGSAKVWFCSQYNGGGCWGYLNPNTYSNVNLTPVNSIKLTPN